MAEEKQENSPDLIPIKVIPVNPSNVTREYVNFAHINHGESDFTIDFGDVPPPNEFDRERVLEERKVEVPVKFRLVCNAVFVERLIAALQDNLRKFEAKRQKDE